MRLPLTALAILALLGAGCATPPVADTSVDKTTDDTVTPTDSSSTTMDNAKYTFPGTLPAEQIENKQVRISTNKGDIVIGLYPDTAPNTVSNFVYLASQGYYDGVIFHRVIESFMIQGGDPTGTGTSGPGYKFADELNDNRTYTRGTVAMANAGPNTNGSQFFIMHADNPLPHSYSIFGYVISGLEVVDAIATTPTDPRDRPLEEIVMTKVIIEDKE